MSGPSKGVNDSAPAPALCALGCGGRRPDHRTGGRTAGQPMSSSRTPLVSFMNFATKTIDSAAKAAYTR